MNFLRGYAIFLAVILALFVGFSLLDANYGTNVRCYGFLACVGPQHPGGTR